MPSKTAAAHCLHDSRKTLDIDFSRVHAASESYCVSEMAAVVADSPTFATRIGEDKKAQKDTKATKTADTKDDEKAKTEKSKDASGDSDVKKAANA